MKLTPWFPADVKPVHVGWYCTDDPLRGGESAFTWYWDGRHWRADKGDWICNQQNRQWRGLANPPKETKQKGEKK